METMAHGWFIFASLGATFVVTLTMAWLMGRMRGHAGELVDKGDLGRAREANEWADIIRSLARMVLFAGLAVAALSAVLNVVRYAKGG